MMLVYAVVFPIEFLLQNEADIYNHELTSHHDCGEIDQYSGIEILSTPQKKKIHERDNPFEIEGVGFLSSTWMGQRGKRELVQEVHDESERSESQTLKRELRTFAKVCGNALGNLGAHSSNDPQVKNAIELCDSYLSLKKKKMSVSQKLNQLWKSGELSASQDEISTDPAQIASAVLGNSLVDAITEKDKQPPDVSGSANFVVFLL